MRMPVSRTWLIAIWWLFASFSDEHAHAKKLRHYLVGFSREAKKAANNEYNRLRNERGPFGQTSDVKIVRNGISISLERVKFSDDHQCLTKIWSFSDGETATMRMWLGELPRANLFLDEKVIPVFPLNWQPDALAMQAVSEVPPLGEMDLYLRSMKDPRVLSRNYSAIVQQNGDSLVVEGIDHQLDRIDLRDLTATKEMKRTLALEDTPESPPVRIGRALFDGRYRIAAEGHQTSFYEEGFDIIEKFRIWTYDEPGFLSVLTWREGATGILNNLSDKKVTSYEVSATSHGGPYFEARQGDDRFFISNEDPHRVSAPFRRILGEDEHRYIVENKDRLRWFIFKHGAHGLFSRKPVDPKAGMFPFRGEPIDDLPSTAGHVLVRGMSQVLELSQTEPEGWGRQGDQE